MQESGSSRSGSSQAQCAVCRRDPCRCSVILARLLQQLDLEDASTAVADEAAEDWTVVAPAPEPEPEGTEEAPAASSGAAPDARPGEGAPEAAAPEAAAPQSPPVVRRGARSSAADRVWAYAVWFHPLRPDLRGIHTGGRIAWYELEATLPDGRYRFPTRLRRFRNEQEALEGYEAEAARHRAPLPPALHRHPW